MHSGGSQFLSALSHGLAQLHGPCTFVLICFITHLVATPIHPVLPVHLSARPSSHSPPPGGGAELEAVCGRDVLPGDLPRHPTPSAPDVLRTRHTLEPWAWHWSHWPGRLVNPGGECLFSDLVELLLPRPFVRYNRLSPPVPVGEWKCCRPCV